MDTKPGSSKEQQDLLTAEPSLQSQTHKLLLSFTLLNKLLLEVYFVVCSQFAFEVTGISTKALGLLGTLPWSYAPGYEWIKIISICLKYIQK